MDDEYISKKKALNLIEHNDKVFHYADKQYEDIVYATTQKICVAVADMQAADVYPVNQWISVKDRLPEDNKPVLCFVIDTTGEGRTYVIGSCEHSEFWFLKIGDNKRFSFPYMQIKVTHWQPLPEPPKEG